MLRLLFVNHKLLPNSPTHPGNPDRNTIIPMQASDGQAGWVSNADADETPRCQSHFSSFR